MTSSLHAPYLYPPESSTSSLNLNKHTASTSSINLAKNEASVRHQELSLDEPITKSGWTHRSVNTAFGQLNVNMFLKRKYIKWYIALIVIAVLVILMTVYHHQIVNWMEPWALKLEKLPGGWAIPIGILFVISFPPLFGHEVVAILCGVVWGLWVGFAIVAAGTLIGEIGNFFVFRWCCQTKARKLEREDMTYACMTRTVQEGGFKIIFLARLSAIPGHLTTAVFATCGMSFWTFLLATILTLPKQLQVVYLGVIFDQEESAKSTASKIITDTVLVLSFLVTFVAAYYIYVKMAKWRPIVEREWAEKQQEDAALATGQATIQIYSGLPIISRTNTFFAGDETRPLAAQQADQAGFRYHDPYSQSSPEIPFMKRQQSAHDYQYNQVSQQTRTPSQKFAARHSSRNAESQWQDRHPYAYDPNASRQPISHSFHPSEVSQQEETPRRHYASLAHQQNLRPAGQNVNLNYDASQYVMPSPPLPNDSGQRIR